MLYGVRCISVVCCMRGTFQKDSVCSPTISAYAVYSAAATEGCPFHLRDTVDTTHNRIGLCPIRYGMYRLGSLRRTRHARMHAGAQLLLPVEWIGRVCDRHDRIDDLCLPIRDGAPTSTIHTIQQTFRNRVRAPPKSTRARLCDSATRSAYSVRPNYTMRTVHSARP
jgi:hypothetical protein